MLELYELNKLNALQIDNLYLLTNFSGSRNSVQFQDVSIFCYHLMDFAGVSLCSDQFRLSTKQKKLFFKKQK